MASCPGSTFGRARSFINYGQNNRPELLTAALELSVGMPMANAKCAGTPMAAMGHMNGGHQHSAMAIYNAFATAFPQHFYG